MLDAKEQFIILMESTLGRHAKIMIANTIDGMSPHDIFVKYCEAPDVIYKVIIDGEKILRKYAIKKNSLAKDNDKLVKEILSALRNDRGKDYIKILFETYVENLEIYTNSNILDRLTTNYDYSVKYEDAVCSIMHNLYDIEENPLLYNKSEVMCIYENKLLLTCQTIYDNIINMED